MTRLGQMLYDNGRQEGEKFGRQEGERLGKQEGEARLSKLITILLSANLTKEIALVTSDEKAREEYYVKYNIE